MFERESIRLATLSSTMDHQPHGDLPHHQQQPEKAESSDTMRVLNSISPLPDPEFGAQRTLWQYSVEYHLWVLEEIARCDKGEVGMIIRIEPPYASNITAWRRARQNEVLKPRSTRERARKSSGPSPIRVQSDRRVPRQSEDFAIERNQQQTLPSWTVCST